MQYYNAVLYLTICHTSSTCKGGTWECTEIKCQGTCIIYGSGHYSTFDQQTYEFQGDCAYIAVKVNNASKHLTNDCVQNHSLVDSLVLTV